MLFRLQITINGGAENVRSIASFPPGQSLDPLEKLQACPRFQLILGRLRSGKRPGTPPGRESRIIRARRRREIGIDHGIKGKEGK